MMSRMALEQRFRRCTRNCVMGTLPLCIFANIGVQGQQDAHFIVGIHIPRHQIESHKSLRQQSRGNEVGTTDKTANEFFFSPVLCGFLIIQMYDTIGHPGQLLLYFLGPFGSNAFFLIDMTEKIQRFFAHFPLDETDEDR